MTFTNMLIKMDDAEYSDIRAKATPISGHFDVDTAKLYRIVGR